MRRIFVQAGRQAIELAASRRFTASLVPPPPPLQPLQPPPQPSPPPTPTQQPLPSPLHSTTLQAQRATKTKAVVVLDEAEIEEVFVRGRGPGGQAINKNKSCVQLTHLPTGTRVSCQEARDLTTNRRIARKLLRDKLDLLLNGPLSRIGLKEQKIRKRKAKAKKRQRDAKAHDSLGGGEGGGEGAAAAAAAASENEDK